VYNNLELLKWEKEIGCYWSRTICEEAVKRGNSYVIKWAAKKEYLHKENLGERIYCDI
jgi:hypothetical protein